MRKKYGGLIDFEINKVDETELEFIIHSQHPETRPDGVYSDKEHNRKRFTYFLPFNKQYPLYSVNFYSYLEILESTVYLIGTNNSQWKSLSDFDDTIGRDAAYEGALLALEAWSMFPPCLALWQVAEKHTQLSLL